MDQHPEREQKKELAKSMVYLLKFPKMQTLHVSIKKRIEYRL